VLVDGEAAEPVGFGAVGGGGVLLDAAKDVACHGCCSDREGRGGEEEEAEGARRSVWGGGELHRLLHSDPLHVIPMAMVRAWVE
jgi:hypothetical protein